jgi:hypothetical protein
MAEPATSERFRVTAVTPVFNDWAAASLMLRELDRHLAATHLSTRALVVNDGSTEAPPPDFGQHDWLSFERVEILDLHRNLGHQRALCCGLVAAYEERSAEALLVLDADGEDSARDALRLLRRFFLEGGGKMVFAARGRRTEGLLFRAFYQLYRAIHLVLIGDSIRIGNFSVIPASALPCLVRSGGLWVHYAAAAIKSRLPLVMAPIDRAKRLHGASKMNFIGLVIHGFRALTVHIDTVAARALVMACFALVAGAAAVGMLAWWGAPAIPLGLVALLVLMQIVALAVTFTLTVVMTSAVPEVIPLEHCKVFLAGRRRVDWKGDQPVGAEEDSASVGGHLARLQSDLVREHEGETKVLHLVPR